MKKALEGSWKSTATALILAVTNGLVEVLPTLGVEWFTPEFGDSVQSFMITIAVIVLGFFVRDDKVSSEKAGAK